MTAGLVIGVGSPLMGDDGLGLAALEALRAGWTFEPELELMDGGTWGMNLLPFIESVPRVLMPRLQACARNSTTSFLTRSRELARRRWKILQSGYGRA
jgi:hypothetical protein